jgi:putative transposase
VAQQLREATPFGESPIYLIRDNDREYGEHFADVAAEIESLRTPVRAPRANAFCERFIGSLRRDCLDHVLILSKKQLRRLVNDYVQYFNEDRPHQGINQRIPAGLEPSSGEGEIVVRSVLGGKLCHSTATASPQTWLSLGLTILRKATWRIPR